MFSVVFTPVILSVAKDLREAVYEIFRCAEIPRRLGMTVWRRISSMSSVVFTPVILVDVKLIGAGFLVFLLFVVFDHLFVGCEVIDALVWSDEVVVDDVGEYLFF